MAIEAVTLCASDTFYNPYQRMKGISRNLLQAFRRPSSAVLRWIVCSKAAFGLNRQASPEP